MNLSNKKVLLTGASSMLGGQIFSQLQLKGAYVEPIFHKDTDLLSEHQTFSRFDKFRPDICINAAGFNGSIRWNELYGYDIFTKTTKIGLNVTTACVKYDVPFLYNLITSCSYPTEIAEKRALVEEDFLSSPPHASVSCHAHAKRNWVIAAEQARKQYGLRTLGVIFNNCYGHEKFDSQKTKVAGALIKKFVDAKRHGNKIVEIWGSGKVKRELLYFEDAATGLIKAIECDYDNEELPLLNIGNGRETSIADLALLIRQLSGYNGEIIFNTTFPDGQMTKLLDSTRMRTVLRWEPPTSLEDGLAKTIKYYESLAEMENPMESDR